MTTNLLLGMSINKPFVFNGRNYDVWKNKIETFVKSIYFDLWYIVMDGLCNVLITKKVKTSKKTKKELNKNDKRIIAQNIQVMDIFGKF